MTYRITGLQKPRGLRPRWGPPWRPLKSTDNHDR
jgi:hypothetical protein